MRLTEGQRSLTVAFYGLLFLSGLVYGIVSGEYWWMLLPLAPFAPVAVCYVLFRLFGWGADLWR